MVRRFKLFAGVFPFIIIFVAYLFSISWWNVYFNAVSDLGNPTYCLASALVLDIGFVLSGFLFFYYSVRYCSGFGSLLFSIVSIFLALVGAIDEVFGLAHFIISVLFFLSMAVFVLYYGILRRDVLIFSWFSICVVLWVLHFGYHVPPGAAIPELVSAGLGVYTFIRYL